MTEQEFKNRLIQHFEDIIDTESMQSLFNLLDKGNFCLELKYQLPSMDGFDEIFVPFIYLYDSNCYRDYFEYKQLRDRKDNRDKILPINRNKELIKNVSLYWANLHSSSLFDTINELLFAYSQQKLPDDRLTLWGYIVVYIDGFMVLGFDCDECDINENMNDIRYIDSQNKYLPEYAVYEWFRDLNSDTKVFLLNGTHLINNYQPLFKSSQILDYTPFIISFVKALENEFYWHYINNFDAISESAADYLEKYQKYLKEKTSESSIPYKLSNLYKRLEKTCLSIRRHEENFHMNGLSTGYQILTFLGGTKKLDIKFTNYLTESQLMIIQKEEKLLNEINSMGHFRNIYIHQNILQSENELFIHQNILVLSLKLLSEIGS